MRIPASSVRAEHPGAQPGETSALANLASEFLHPQSSASALASASVSGLEGGLQAIPSREFSTPKVPLREALVTPNLGEKATVGETRTLVVDFGSPRQESEGPWPPTSPGGSSLPSPSFRLLHCSAPSQGGLSHGVPSQGVLQGVETPPLLAPALAQEARHPSSKSSHGGGVGKATAGENSRAQARRDRLQAACDAAELQASMEAQRKLTQQKIAAIWAELETECLQIWHEVMLHRQKVMQDLLDKWTRLLVD